MEWKKRENQKTKEDESFLGMEILKKCRSDLYGKYPFLDTAFAGVGYRSSHRTERIGTDGNHFYYCPRFLIQCFAESPAAVRSGYLHMLLHCLFLHIVREERREERLWNLACDMAVEQILQQEGLREGIPDSWVREACLGKLEGRSLSAEQIYSMLEEGIFPAATEEMEAAFCFDDHSFWRENGGSEGAALRSKWEKIREHTGQQGCFGQSRAGSEWGSQEEEWERLPASRYDYRNFLKRFAVLREEAELDTESFDYILYSYGMEHYGNLPLIEPLEYKEVNRLEELVIAIDTSGSCTAQMVSRFLGETYGILAEKENFFRKMKVYLIQCDCSIQDVTVIRSGEEWEEYRSHAVIKGRAGTDFRPVFRYVEQEREKKNIRNLRALIYFTDGDGVYPGVKPDYETAFVFVKRTPFMGRVPGWARTLITGE
ncbi:MAG: VWA-like domain-containing protein [Lachnospiraceae bacterium]|nr:VWA-like domain-containing protein [Lachnospiraceae bacterium]